MSDFPTSIYTPRETENLPGIVYDDTKKQNFFSEDFQNLAGEINAIETYLLTPKIYRAFIVQHDTDFPIVTVLENSLGFDPTWERGGAGYYESSDDGWHDLIDAVILVQFSMPFMLPGGSVGYCNYYKEEAHIEIHTLDDTNTPSDNMMSDSDTFQGASLEIRVYV